MLVLKALASKDLLLHPHVRDGVEDLDDSAHQALEFRLEHLSAAGFRLVLLDRL